MYSSPFRSCHTGADGIERKRPAQWRGVRGDEAHQQANQAQQHEGSPRTLYVRIGRIASAYTLSTREARKEAGGTMKQRLIAWTLESRLEGLYSRAGAEET
jgi:hypothetical protein